MIDKKRRKLKDNPYAINYLEEKEIYIVSFKNIINHYDVEVSKEIYDLFNKFELEDISYMNKYDRHIEHLPLNEVQIYNRLSYKRKNIEEQSIQNIENKKLYYAINKLPKIQKTRIYLYYFYNMNQKEIAIRDNCSIRAVS